ncbi:hypothetical protein Solca_3878 [Solitalea canadensis DSM 3403]|uniref:Uncharacterized protein n=1 Tax=Solitalea canadensis (strain ATCC 29591 / DSM 3403 / JCM 21819 / LMG 8368 / NBRC 15130 / NCIMB 12057 / USAM 9D) TaxID=929556 RepID=H8KLI8_SOLCM|nr:hypothetical protein Solca_3878 [Solitalea canadensis DSM 3403]
MKQMVIYLWKQEEGLLIKKDIMKRPYFEEH